MRRITGLWVTLVCAALPIAASGDEADDLRASLLKAREKHYQMKSLEVVYGRKKQINAQMESLLGDRRALITEIRQRKAVAAGFPGRRNSDQQAFVMGIHELESGLASLDRDIDELKANARAVDEAVLEQAERLGTRVGPNNRRDILNIYPAVQMECRASFEEVRSAVTARAARLQGSTPEEVFRNAVAELDRSGETAKYGKSNEFVADYRKFVGSTALNNRNPRRPR
jgi:hypothetical protein